MKFLQALNNGLARVEAVALTTCLLTMLFVAFFQVVMRNIYGEGYVWADIMVRILVLWVGLFGAAIATAENTHLSIDALSKFLPTRITRITTVLVRIFAFVVCVLLAKAAVEYIEMEQQSGAESIFDIPVAITESIIPIAFILMSIHFSILIIQAIAAIFHPIDDPISGPDVP